MAEPPTKSRLRRGLARVTGLQRFATKEHENSAVAEARVIAEPPPPVYGPADSKSPSWILAIQSFERDHKEQYDLIAKHIGGIRDPVTIARWDTWNNRPGNKPEGMFIRKCKAHLPSFKTFKSLATSLSGLDPHKIAPIITTGAFVLVELCFETADPELRDKALAVLLNISILISKWSGCEEDVKQMKKKPNTGCLNGMDVKLGELYTEALMLMSDIYKSGATRLRRTGAVLATASLDWDRAYRKLEGHSSTCSRLKEQAELEIKRAETNTVTFDWIMNTSKSTEPSHGDVRLRTGIEEAPATVADAGDARAASTAAMWFVEHAKFTSWIDEIRSSVPEGGDEEGMRVPEKRVLWLKGPVGTGKTTVMCRVISHFEEFPVRGVRFIRYYCFDSQASDKSRGPSLEAILRALCARLAWKGDGSLEDVAIEDCNEYKKADKPPNIATWQSLLRRLLDASTTAVVFIIDALDECEMGVYEGLLELLKELQTELPEPRRLYYLLSSKPNVQQIVAYFGADAVQVMDTVDPKAAADLSSFITRQVDARARHVKWKDSLCCKQPRATNTHLIDVPNGRSVQDGHRQLRGDLESALSVTAGGMFRWVEIWLGIFFPLNKKIIRQPSVFNDRLAKLKKSVLTEGDEKAVIEGEKTRGIKVADKTLQKSYEILWKLNFDDPLYEKLQVVIFQVVMGAKESLGPQQLLDAVLFHHHDDDLILGLDGLQELYYNFLRINKAGHLDFEHSSAKYFVSEMKGEDDKLIFSEEKTKRALANLAIRAIKEPDNTVWTDAGVRLAELGTEVKMALPPTPDVPVEMFRTKFGKFSVFNFSPNRFGTYLFQNWIRHCQDLRDDAGFLEDMGVLFRSHLPGVENWIFSRARRQKEEASLEYGTLVLKQSTAADGTITSVISPSPLLCMMAFQFSPFSHDATLPPILMNGFADADVRNLDQQTPLHVACLGGNNAVVEDILKFTFKTGTDQDLAVCKKLLSSTDTWRCIPLHYAQTDVVAKTLLKYISLVNKTSLPDAGVAQPSPLLHQEDRIGKTPLMNILVTCTDDFIGWVLDRYFVPATNLTKLLYKAAATNRLQTAKKHILPHLDHAALDDLDAGYYGTPLSVALKHGHLEMASLLRDHGATFAAAGCGARVNQGVKPQAEGEVAEEAHKREACGSVLAVAAARKKVEVMAYLLENGENVNAQLEEGKFGSALAVAAAKGEAKEVRFLLDRGADVNLILNNGEYGTALVAAAARGNMAIVRVLVNAGADVRREQDVQVGRWARPASAIDAARGHPLVVELLSSLPTCPKGPL